jgi:hypothetical protein
MTRGILFAVTFLTCLIIGNFAAAPAAKAMVAGKAAFDGRVQTGEGMNAGMTEIRHRRRFRPYFYIGPSIGIYFGSPHRYRRYRHYRRPYLRRSYRRSYGGRCSYWARRCAENWGYRNSDFYGCLRYHGC